MDNLWLISFMFFKCLVDYHWVMCLLITLGEVSVLLVHVEGIGICLLTGDRSMIRLLTRYLEWLAELAIRLNATLICKMFLVKHSQTLEVLISFEYFMPIYFLEFKICWKQCMHSLPLTANDNSEGLLSSLILSVTLPLPLTTEFVFQNIIHAPSYFDPNLLKQI